MKIKCFENYPSSKFKLIAINDINCTYPHRYNVLFQNIDTLEKFEEKLLPEELRGYYIIGNIYSIKGLEVENTNKIDQLHVAKIKVNKNHSFKIKDKILFNPSYGIDLHDDFYKQNCFIYETKAYVYLIPHYVVANRYYFVSTSIKKALSKGSFKSLYYEEQGYKFDYKTLYLKTKQTVKDEQLPLIARMITDITSKNNFMFFYKRITQEKLKGNTHMPITMGFPFNDRESFKLKCNILNLGNVYSTDNFKSFDLRKVVMITHIIGDKIPYNYETLRHKVYKEDIYNQSKSINKDNTKTIPKSNPQPTGIISNRFPSDKYTKAKESFRVSNEYDFSDINISKEEIIQKSTRMIYDITDEVVDESFEQSKTGSYNNKIREKLLDDNITRNSFQIDNFNILFEYFIDSNNIKNYSISELIKLDNHDESSINKFYIDIKKELPRNLIYGYFVFNNILINFIEVEHNIYWDKNTWYFISSKIFSEEQVQLILNTYILQNQSTKQMLKETIPIGGLKFFMTKHQSININDEDNIKKWCKNLELGIKRCNKSKK